MRKIKIMLFSLLVLGVIGGALAFKVKFNKIYCTSTIPAGGVCNVTCPNMVASTTLNGIINLCYTTPLVAGDGCKPKGFALNCQITARAFRTN